MVMKSVFVLVGAPASGKSQWVTQRGVDEYTKVVSTDEYRLEMFGSLTEGNLKENQSELYAKVHSDIKGFLADEGTRTIYYDATNINRRRRRALYRNIKGWSKEMAEVHIVYFSVPRAELLRRNATRVGVEKVPEAVIYRMYETMQVPRAGVDCDTFSVQGVPMFDSTAFLKGRVGNGKEELSSLLAHSSEDTREELKGVYSPHDCAPHHMESIDEHIAMCIDTARAPEYNNLGIRIIALFHDLGKAITKKTVETDGEPFSTFRGHADVSANYFLNFIAYLDDGDYIYRESYRDLMEIIRNHMHFHNGIGEKNIRNNRLNGDVLEIGKLFAHVDNISRIRGEDEVVNEDGKVQ